MGVWHRPVSDRRQAIGITVADIMGRGNLPWNATETVQVACSAAKGWQGRLPTATLTPRCLNAPGCEQSHPGALFYNYARADGGVAGIGTASPTSVALVFTNC